MKIKFRAPVVLGHEDDSAETHAARLDLRTAEAVVTACKKKLALTKKEAYIINKVRNQLGADVSRVMTAIRGDLNHD